MTPRKLLTLDSHYSFEAISERGLESSITCRDLDGFFDKVWSVHAFATIVTSENWTSKFGRPEYYSLSPVHIFIEGKIGRFTMLNCLPPLNFLISQVDIFCTLFRLIRKEKISVIRADEPTYNGLLGWALSRLLGIPLLLRVGANHDKNFEDTGQIHMPKLFKTRRIEKICERFLLSRADCVAGANQDNLNFALANGARHEASTLFRYGNLISKHHFIDPSERQEGKTLLKEMGVEPGRFLLNIARLENLKHPDHLLRILAKIRRRGQNVKMVLVGDGNLRPMLVDLAKELKIENQVVLCGNKNQEWLSRVIPLAAVVVSPFMGRALTEAALGGAPIVAYDVDWQSELIKTGVTGELVPNLNWEEMAEVVERFLNRPEYARAMGDAVHKRALEMMDPETLNQHERDIFQKLIEGSNLNLAE